MGGEEGDVDDEDLVLAPIDDQPARRLAVDDDDVVRCVRVLRGVVTMLRLELLEEKRRVLLGVEPGQRHLLVARRGVLAAEKPPVVAPRGAQLDARRRPHERCVPRPCAGTSVGSREKDTATGDKEVG